MVSVNEELHFKFHLINLNWHSPLSPVATILDSATLDDRQPVNVLGQGNNIKLSFHRMNFPGVCRLQGVEGSR